MMGLKKYFSHPFFEYVSILLYIYNIIIDSLAYLEGILLELRVVPVFYTSIN